MRLRLLLATCAIAGLLAVPSFAAADSWRDCHCYNPCYGYGFGSNWHAYEDSDRYMAHGYEYDYPYAVAGYSSINRHASMRKLDNSRIAEYEGIFGPSKVAGYAGTFTPWMDGGTWVSVNGQRYWATPDDFMWSNNRWVWSDSPTATVMFDDSRYQMTTREWFTPSFTTRTRMGSATWSPWNDGGTWATVNGQRVWVTEDDFVWMNNRWTWADDDSAMVEFDDDRVNLNSRDWDISVDNDRLDIDNDRFDIDPDLDADQFEVDPDRFNIDEDRLQIETDID